MTDAERAVIEAAIELYLAHGGVPGLNAGRKLDKAVEALLIERRESR